MASKHKAKLPVSVLIMTQNEEANIKFAVESVLSHFDQIIVTDSYSTDNTVSIINKFPTVELYQHKFIHWADQRNWMLKNCNLRNDVIFFLDADEYIDERLIGELKTLIESGEYFAAAFLEREYIFLGRNLHYAHGHPAVERIFRREGLSFKGEGAREYALYDGPSVRMKSPYIHNDRNPISVWVEKHNNNSNREALLHIIRHSSANKSIDINDVNNTRRRGSLIIRRTIWFRLPFFLRGLLYFTYRYLFRMGFLDGKEGFIYVYLHAFWYNTLIDVKIIESRRNSNPSRIADGKNINAIRPTEKPKLSVTVLIMAQNEEANIGYCIESVFDSFNQVIVTDSFSTDRTVEICKNYPGVEVYSHAFTGWAEQRNWMLEKCSIKNDIIFFLDADELVLPDFVRELNDLIESKVDFTAIMVKIRFYFLCRQLRYAYGHPSIARLFRKDGLRFLGEGAREYACFSGISIKMKSAIRHQDRKPLSSWISKHNRNSDREAQLIAEGLTLCDQEVYPYSKTLRMKLWIRANIWANTPFLLKELFYFFYRYVIKLGFLDGSTGFIYCYLHAFWYETIIDIKIIEKQIKQYVKS